MLQMRILPGDGSADNNIRLLFNSESGTIYSVGLYAFFGVNADTAQNNT